MAALTVRPVTRRRERRKFLKFPWSLYGDDPNWTPPLRGNQKELVGYAPHPFYADNEAQTFLAYRSGKVCGRVAAILNQTHIERYSERRGFFGFFECVDDQEVANGLFDAVGEWFAKRDIHCMRGPANPSMNYEVGLLVDGFDSPATFMMTYNPPYYARLIEEYGFHKAHDLYAYWGNLEMLPKVSAKLDPIARQIVERYDITLRPLGKSHFLEDVEAFLSIFNRSMTAHWGFVPMSTAEIRRVAQGLRHLLVPELVLGAEIDGQLIGAVLGMPDYNPRIKQIDGRLFPFGFLRLIRNKHRIGRIRMISTNVVPEYQRMGVGLVLMHGLGPRAIKFGFKEGEFSWVSEANTLSRGSLEKGGAKRTKTYRLYDLN